MMTHETTRDVAGQHGRLQAVAGRQNGVRQLDSRHLSQADTHDDETCDALGVFSIIGSQREMSWCGVNLMMGGA